MEILKQAASILLFGTVIWLVWVFNQTASSGALVFLLSGFLLLAIAGWILGRWPAKSAATVAAIVVLACAVALPIWSLRAFAPTTAVNAQNTQWQPFTPQLVARYQAQGKPVFVDFTASWCLSCQVNERVVLDRADVQQRLNSSGVELVRADWTRKDPTIANALAALGRSGVPTYVLYPADASVPPKILPEVLTPGIVFRALDSVKAEASPSAKTEARVAPIPNAS
jgi:thiol:disulfide interchange protein DsbD